MKGLRFGALCTGLFLLWGILTPLGLQGSSVPESEILPLPPVAGAAEPAADLIQVQVPQSLPFVLDLFEQSGRGQIFSETFEIVNKGSQPVQFILADMRLILQGADPIECMPEPIDHKEGSGAKKLYMQLDASWQGEGVPITAQGTTEKVLLLAPAGQEGDKLTFSFSGSMTTDLTHPMQWKAGDVRIRIEYRLEPVTVPAPVSQDSVPESQPEVESVSESVTSSEMLPESVSQEVDPDVSSESQP